MEKTICFTGHRPNKMAGYKHENERCHQLPYRSTLKAKVNGYKLTRLLPPPKGSGFPPTTTERILFMNIMKGATP